MSNFQPISKLSYVRTVTPEVENAAYRNINYGGFNKCIVKDSDTGYVLPNCVGYCWGRAIEYTKDNSPDLSNNDANVWFTQNKVKFDEGTGGYPYIDFQNLQISIASGVIKDIGSVDNLIKLVNIPGMIIPGAIICYDKGQNYGYTNTDGTTGIYYPSPGHLQTIEVVYNDESLFNRTKVKAAIRSLLATLAVDATFALYLGIFNNFLWKMWITPAKLSHIALKMLNKKIISFKTWQKLNNLIVSIWHIGAKISKYSNYIYAILFIMAASNTDLSTYLSGIDGTLAYLKFRISESNISSSGNKLFDTTFQDLNKNLEYWNSHAGTTTNVQGIILVPPYVRPVSTKKKGFPWQLGNNIGLYD